MQLQTLHDTPKNLKLIIFIVPITCYRYFEQDKFARKTRQMMGKNMSTYENKTCPTIQNNCCTFSCTQTTRGCGRWGAARYGAVLAVEYVRAVLGLSRSVLGGKGSLRHLSNIKLIGQQAAKLWGFFANTAISRRDLDLWPLDLEIGPRSAGVPGTLPTKFGIRRPFRFPSRWKHGTDRQTDGRTDRINTWWRLLLDITQSTFITQHPSDVSPILPAVCTWHAVVAKNVKHLRMFIDDALEVCHAFLYSLHVIQQNT